jgi:hypothetical protein
MNLCKNNNHFYTKNFTKNLRNTQISWKISLKLIMVNSRLRQVHSGQESKKIDEI